MLDHPFVPLVTGSPCRMSPSVEEYYIFFLGGSSLATSSQSLNETHSVLHRDRQSFEVCTESRHDEQPLSLSRRQLESLFLSLII